MYCSPPGSSVHEFSKQEYQSGLPFPSPGDLPYGSNLGLSHCRQILYHLSHQGSPVFLSSPILWGLVSCSLFFLPTWPAKISPGINRKTKVTALIRFWCASWIIKEWLECDRYRESIRVFFLSCNPFVIQSQTLWSEVKWALGSTAVDKASGCDEIPVELFKTLMDDVIKVLHSLC